MFKLFSNTIPAYLESDLNTFVKNQNCQILSISYNTCILEGEVMHNVLLYYKIIPAE